MIGPLDHLETAEFQQQWETGPLMAIRLGLPDAMETAQKFVLVHVFGSIFDYMHDPIFHARVTMARNLLGVVDDEVRKKEVP